MENYPEVDQNETITGIWDFQGVANYSNSNSQYSGR